MYDVISERLILMQTITLNNGDKTMTNNKQQTVTVEAGSYGVCKNGSYWFKTIIQDWGCRRGKRGDLAFITAAHVTVNADGSATVDNGAAFAALSTAALRSGNGVCFCRFAGSEVNVMGCPESF